MSAFNLFQKKKEILSQQVPENVQMKKPETASQSYQQGWLLYAAGKYEAAIEYYQQALRENPNHVEALYALGLALKAAGDKDKAVASFEKVLSLIPTLEDLAKATMLNRLTQGQISHIRQGNWDPIRKNE